MEPTDSSNPEQYNAREVSWDKIHHGNFEVKVLLYYLL